jgi:lipopolysaccharide biosynthesis glycosyltransferase
MSLISNLFKKNTASTEPVSPTGEVATEKSVVPVVFAVTDAYVPPLSVTLQTILEQTKPELHEYRFFVLHQNLSPAFQDTLRAQVVAFLGCTLDFIDVTPYIAGYEFQNLNFSLAAFFRFVIPYVFQEFPLVIYLDSDLLCREDIANLLGYRYENSVLGVARRVFNSRGRTAIDCATVIGLLNPKHYFNSGVLVFNTANFRAMIGQKEVMEMAASTTFTYPDQDVLNVLCEGKITYFPIKWNISLVADIPELTWDEKEDYDEGRSRPSLIHFNAEKPWQPPKGLIYPEWRDLFWTTAAKTPFLADMEKMRDKFDELQKKRAEVLIDPENDECIFSTNDPRENEEIEKLLYDHEIPFKVHQTDAGAFRWNLYVPIPLVEQALAALTETE